MSSILENKQRIGRFTSSEMYKIMSNDKKGTGIGAIGLTYIEEKKLERQLGRGLELDATSQAMRWGSFMEEWVHEKHLSSGYKYMSDVTMVHPEYPELWAGSQDTIHERERVVSDIKCYEPKNFAVYNNALIKSKETGDLSYFKEVNKGKEFYQLLSNACIWGFDLIEAIVFMPYESELDGIKEMAYNYKGENEWKYRFIYEGNKTSLACLPDDCKTYKNINIYRFEVPSLEKDLLISRVKEASKLLNN